MSFVLTTCIKGASLEDFLQGGREGGEQIISSTIEAGVLEGIIGYQTFRPQNCGFLEKRNFLSRVITLNFCLCRR